MTISKSDNRTYLTAAKGKVVTDGAEICGKKIILAVGLSHEGFLEVDEETVTTEPVEV